MKAMLLRVVKLNETRKWCLGRLHWAEWGVKQTQRQRLSLFQEVQRISSHWGSQLPYSISLQAVNKFYLHEATKSSLIMKLCRHESERFYKTNLRKVCLNPSCGIGQSDQNWASVAAQTFLISLRRPWSIKISILLRNKVEVTDKRNRANTDIKMDWSSKSSIQIWINR